jgi:iduronate 2-sulfatase
LIFFSEASFIIYQNIEQRHEFKLAAMKKAIILSLAFISGLLSACSLGEKKSKPNVLFIAVDDLRTELNCYGASHIHSPNIDRLASEGVRFTNAHVQQAICMASRASILSGIRPEHNEIYATASVQELMPEILTINRFFESNGYNIAACGKIYHYGIDHETQFGDAYMQPEETWTGRGYVSRESIEKKALNTKYDRGSAYECTDVPDSIYRDGANTQLAVRRLTSLREEGKPFFLAVGLTKPHLPFVAPKKYWDLYPASSIELPEVREMPENSSEYTMRPGGELTSYYGMPATFEKIDDSTTLLLRHGYFACVSYIDAQIGMLLDQLEKLGLMENTIVVLWGDHGFKLGDYKRWCKWSNMNIDTHIPYIFSFPDGMKGAVCNTPVEALDIYPTLAELCGLEKPAHLEGQSIVENLNNPETEQDRYVCTVWPLERTNYEKTVMGYSIKNKRYNYVEWVKLSSGEVMARELYDHQVDPNETVNLAGKSEYDEINAELEMVCKRYKEEV